jgi:hypothetical protein
MGKVTAFFHDFWNYFRGCWATGYTHVGELAAGRAVALLPSVMSDAKPEQTKREHGEILRDVQAILKTMSAKNWREKKATALSLLAAN